MQAASASVSPLLWLSLLLRWEYVTAQETEGGSRRRSGGVGRDTAVDGLCRPFFYVTRNSENRTSNSEGSLNFIAKRARATAIETYANVNFTNPSKVLCRGPAALPFEDTPVASGAVRHHVGCFLRAPCKHFTQIHPLHRDRFTGWHDNPVVRVILGRGSHPALWADVLNVFSALFHSYLEPLCQSGVVGQSVRWAFVCWCAACEEFKHAFPLPFHTSHYEGQRRRLLSSHRCCLRCKTGFLPVSCFTLFLDSLASLESKNKVIPTTKRNKTPAIVAPSEKTKYSNSFVDVEIKIVLQEQQRPNLLAVRLHRHSHVPTTVDRSVCIALYA